MDIGDILRQRRERRGETLEEVAFRAGTGAGNLSRIERNLQSPVLSTLEKLCEALEISLIEALQEAKGASRDCYVRDPASAFDKDTRELLAVTEELVSKQKQVLVRFAESLRDSGLS